MMVMKKMRSLLLCLAMLTACSVMAEQKNIELNLSIDDIKAVHIGASEVRMKLTDEATIKLATITGANIGKPLEVKINSISIIRNVIIHAKLDSGNIEVHTVSNKQLLNLLKSRSK